MSRCRKSEEEDPLQEGDEDTLTPKPTLPIEIWERIFLSVEEWDPNNFLMLINSSPEWRRILKPRIPSALLPLVLPILLEHSDDDDEQLLQNILIWRTVSKSAKQTIDNRVLGETSNPVKYYEFVSATTWETLKRGSRGSPDYTTHEYLSGRNQRLHYISKKNGLTIYGRRECGRLSRHFSGNLEGIVNPFLTKSVHLGIHDSNEDVHSVLRLYGHRISALSLWIAISFTLESALLELYQLQNCPNLRILRIGGVLNYVRKVEENNEPVAVQDLPPLNYLEQLDLENGGHKEEVFPFLFLFLEHYGVKFRTLICDQDFFQWINVPTLNSLLPNVRCLRVGPVSKSLLETLKRITWPMEELQLRTKVFFKDHPCYFSPDYRFTHLLGGVATFASSLRHLRILVDLPDEPFNDLEIAVEVNAKGRPKKNNNDAKRVEIINATLPNLTKLSTREFNIFTRWFQHLLCVTCPNLKELQVRSEVEGSKGCCIISGKIAQIVPNLKKVAITRPYLASSDYTVPLLF